MSTAINHNNVKNYIHAAICLGIMVLFGFLPTFSNVTPMGMKILGIFFGMMYGWIFCGYIWPSLAGILIFGFSGYTNLSGALVSGFGHPTVIMLIMCFILVGVITRFDIGAALAGKILGVKALIGKPWMMVFILIYSADLIASISNTFLVFFLYNAILLDLAKKCGWQRGDKKVIFLVFGILFGAGVGCVMFPFHLVGILYTGFMQSAVDITIGYGRWIIWMFVAQTLACIFITLMGKYIFRLNFSELADGDFFEDMRGKALTKDQKIGITIVSIFVLALLLPDFLPADWKLTILLKALGVNGIIMLILIILGIWRKSSGEPMGDLRDFCAKGMNWDVVWLVTSTMPVATAVTSADCGITSSIVSFVSPILGHLNPFMFIIILLTIMGVATQALHNTVLAAMFIPLGCTLLMQMGGNCALLTIAITLVLTPALGTPAGAAQSPLAHGHEYVGNNQKWSYIWGFAILGCTLLAAYITCILLGGFIAG